MRRNMIETLPLKQEFSSLNVQFLLKVSMCSMDYLKRNVSHLGKWHLQSIAAQDWHYKQ